MLSCIVVASLLQHSFTARLVDRGHGDLGLQVRTSRGLQTYPNFWLPNLRPRNGLAFNLRDDNKFKFQGHVFVGRGDHLVDQTTGQQLAMPAERPKFDNAMMFRCKGAISLGKTMLWMFAWDSIEVSLEPSAAPTIYEVALRRGKPVILRQTVAPGLNGYVWTCKVDGQGDHMYFASPQTGIAFNIRSWQVEASTDGWGQTVASTGHVFWSDKGRLLRWNYNKRAWDLTRITDMGDLLGGAQFGREEVLEFSAGLMVVSSGATIPYPKDQRGNPVAQFSRAFYIPGVGMGLVTNPNVHDAGIVVDLPNLHTVGRIVSSLKGITT